jgi:hypothetical protein
MTRALATERSVGVFAAYSASFSVVPVILLHSATNWWSMVLPIMPTGGNAQAYSTVMTIVVAIAVAAFLNPDPKEPAPC